MPKIPHEQYHAGPHHDNNWCLVCGFYYCWHTEAMEKYPELRKTHEHAEKRHKFIPSGKVFTKGGILNRIRAYFVKKTLAGGM